MALPASCPRWTGKIRFPAPKNMPKSMMATEAYSWMDSFFFMANSFCAKPVPLACVINSEL